MSRSFESRSFTTRPSIAIFPPVMSSRPASMRSSVDLPQPEGPTSTMNSPSAMSSEIPWRTLVLPKSFLISVKATEANLCLYRAGGEAGNHVPPERVIDRRRRQRIDQPRRHQQFPRRIIRGDEMAERDCERNGLLVRKQEVGIEVLVPRQEQGVGADGDQRRHHQRQVDQAEELQRRRAIDP